MKKVFLLLLILPFFFACKDDASSSSEPESKPVEQPKACDPACTNGYGCFDGACGCGSAGNMCNPDEICNNGMCKKVRIPACGDGYLDVGEDCDDQNLLDGDGCSSSCKIEYSQENDFCNEVFPCAPGLACSSDGKCERQKKAIDAACASNEECISGNCSEGKCSSN